MVNENTQEILPNLYDIVVFAKEVKMQFMKDGKTSYLHVTDHNGDHWNIFESQIPHANIEVGKAYWFSFQINEKGYPDVISMRLLRNVFKQNAIKELMSRDSILKQVNVAVSYAKDLVIADKIPLGELFAWSNKFYEEFQRKADEVIGEKK